MLVIVRRVLVVVALAVAAVACRIGETRYEEVVEHIAAANPTKTCTPPFDAPDVSKLQACGDGAGHCFDESKTSLTGLPACSGGDVCVPDKVLAANGAKLKACTFFIGNQPGACLSLLVSDVAAHKDELKQDVCDANERCVPCVDPTNGQNTQVCDANGVYKNSCTGGVGTAPTPCCHGAGVCLNPEAVPSDSQGDLDPDTCPGPKLCAPASLVNGKPVSCSAMGLSGVCIDLCFAKLLGTTKTVLRGDCQATEVCLPCVVGATQNVPGC